MEKQQIQANTFTPMYDELEDRVRLIVNYMDPTSRIDIMITRAMLIKLIPLVEEYIEKNFFEKGTKTPQEKSLDYTTQTQMQHIDSVVKEDLLIEVNLSLLEDKQNILLTLTSKDAITRAVLNKDMLKNLLENIKKVIPKYSWGVYF